MVTAVPAFTNTGVAEAVSRWNGDWLSEHIQTAGALCIFRNVTLEAGAQRLLELHFCPPPVL